MGSHHGASGFALTFAMWASMTAVMMMPIVWPWLRALRHRMPEGARPGSVPMFAAGYGVAWAAFSATMAGVQVALVRWGLPAPLLPGAPILAGLGLLAVGGFQLTRLKDACLDHCRSPVGYFATHWRPGLSGALVMGMRHGLFCLGCCWALMAVALVVGMMDLRVMAALMVVMAAETLTPWGRALARPIGVLFLVGGAGVLLLQ